MITSNANYNFALTGLGQGICCVRSLAVVALGMYFLFFRPVLLPEDARYIGTSIQAIRSAAPGFGRWLGHVFNVMGAFMVAAGAASVAFMSATDFL